MKNIAVIYHDADFDGILSNEVCRHWLRRLYPDASIHSYGWDYGRPVPTVFDGCGGDAEDGNPTEWLDYNLIYIVDLSVDELMARQELQPKIVWIDHHKSAIEKWDATPSDAEPEPGCFDGYRIDGVAACRLCWQWFVAMLSVGNELLPEKQDFINRRVSEPELIRLAGEYDIWDHSDPDAKNLQFGLRSLRKAEFDRLVAFQFDTTGSESVAIKAAEYLRNAIADGYVIKAYTDKVNAEYAKKFAYTVKFEGLVFCALIGGRNSNAVQPAAKLHHDALMTWQYDKKVIVSLYHATGHEQHDLSVIAKKYGGGGHRGTCGFCCSLEQFMQLGLHKPVPITV